VCLSPVVEKVKEIGPGTDACFAKLDLNALSAVRESASNVNGMIDNIDVLINNAGIMATDTYTKNEGWD